MEMPGVLGEMLLPLLLLLMVVVVVGSDEICVLSGVLNPSVIRGFTAGHWLLTGDRNPSFRERSERSCSLVGDLKPWSFLAGAVAIASRTGDLNPSFRGGGVLGAVSLRIRSFRNLSLEGDLKGSRLESSAMSCSLVGDLNPFLSPRFVSVDHGTLFGDRNPSLPPLEGLAPRGVTLTSVDLPRRGDLDGILFTSVPFFSEVAVWVEEP